MNSSLAHIPDAKQEQLRSITAVIIRSVRPEKIILFGVYASLSGPADLCPGSELPACLYGFDLLVVTRRGDRRYEHEVQDIIENRCRMHVPLNIFVHDIDYVNKQLSDGGYFFSMIRGESILLFDAGRVPLTDGRAPDTSRILAIAQKDFATWWFRGEAFFKSALFNRQGHERKIAAFLLHQAAENIYQAVLLTFSGYKPCTHNLDRLRRYTNRFSVALALVFPRNTPDEDRLFRLLLLAYVDARYNEEYCISDLDLDLLIGRVRKLLSVAARICRNRFVSLGKPERAA